MLNRDLKLVAAGKGVRLWEIAAAIGITDSSFSRKLRKELSDIEREEILKIINELEEGGKVNAKRV